jgi:peptide-methionine (S)-S-oxide reductase
MKKATFAAGCFWGVEATFQKINGVIKTTVGYMGGNLKNPTYEDVCTDKTGHSEVIRILYNPQKINFEQLLEIFWKIHDPTQLNRQGPDIGTQYKSAIFYHDEQQKKIVEESKNKEQKKHSKTIVTKIIPAEEFYPAEEYHQKYLEKQGLKSCGI